MGINGLLQALKPIGKAVHVSKYKGQKAAVDGYSWLHKGAYCCAKELCEGTWTDKYVTYFMSRIQLLRNAGIEPMIVFDGGRLPIKGEEEHTRHRARTEAREKAAAHLAAGNVAAAVECYQRCVDITPAMAKHVVEELKAKDVQFIMAPYEADAQMAYLARKGDVQLVITEDSDLLAYGCPRVLYKLDRTGAGEEFSLTDLPNCPGLPLSGFTSDQFLQLCIMAGCDFLAQMPGIGLKKAHGLLRKYRSFTKVVKMLRFNGTRVPPDYELRFQMALWAFRHCRVYCPETKRLVHLAPLPGGGLGAADVDVPHALVHLETQQQQEQLDFLGPDLPDHVARGIAKGDLDPMSHKPYDLAAIFAGCRNPPAHIAAQLPAFNPQPHPFALSGPGHSGGGAVSGGIRSALSGAMAGAVSGGGRSGASKPRVGMSRKHTSGQQKLRWGPAAATAASAGARSGGMAAAVAGSGGGAAGKKKSSLGIAKYFNPAPAAPASAATDESAAGGKEAASAAVTEATAAPSMHHGILQALQALRQQQQQRHEQERAEQQQRELEQQRQQEEQQKAAALAAAADDWLGDVVAAAAVGNEAPQFGLPAAKRRRLSSMFDASGSDGAEAMQAGELDISAAVAAEPGVSISAGNDVSMMLDQQQLGVLSSATAGGIHQHDQRSEHLLQQPAQWDCVSIDLVIADSQGDDGIADNSNPSLLHHSPTADQVVDRNCDMFRPATGQSGGLVNHSSQQLIITEILPSGNNSSLSEPGAGRPNVQDSSAIMQQGVISGAGLSGLASQPLCTPQNSLLGALPGHNHQHRPQLLQQDSGGSFGVQGLSDGQSDLQQSQHDSDPFGMQGTTAASKGAAVSALTALMRGMSDQQQQQSTGAAPSYNMCSSRRDRGSSRFFVGSGSGSPGAVHDNTAADVLVLDNISSLGSSSCQSGSMLGSGPYSSSSAGLFTRDNARYDSDDELLQPHNQQKHGNVWMHSSLQTSHHHHNTFRQHQPSLRDLDSPVAAAEEDELSASPPKAHHLALGGSSNQAWKHLQRSLRGRSGLHQHTHMPGQGLSTLASRRGALAQAVPSDSSDAAPGLPRFNVHQLYPAGSIERHQAVAAHRQQAAVPAGEANASGGNSSDGDLSLPSFDIEPLSPVKQHDRACSSADLHMQQTHNSSRHDQWLEQTQQQLLRQQRHVQEGHKQTSQLQGHLLSQQHLQAGTAADSSGTSSGGSSCNDENAEPEDANDIHSIAHIKQFAKLASKVVKKVQKQQQQQHQVSPLGLQGSAANSAAAAAMLGTQRAAGLPSQAFPHVGSKLPGTRGVTKIQQQQRKPSAQSQLMGSKYDASMFIPVQPLEADAGTLQTKTAARQHATHDVTALMNNSGTDDLQLGEGEQSPAKASVLLGRSIRLGQAQPHIAAKPFKAPWQSTRNAEDGSGDLPKLGSSFGAFGSFACGTETRKSDMAAVAAGTRAAGRRLGGKLR